MIERSEVSGRTQREAAEWAVRLQGRTADAMTVQAFYAWRQEPENAKAYARVEALLEDAGALGNDRDIAVAVHDALSRPHPRGSWFGTSRRSWAAVAVAATIALVTLVGVRHGPGAQSFQTATGEQRIVRLDDGTQLRLNTDTEVRVAFRPNRRALELRHGEAFLDVAHDPARPLIVSSGSTSVTAIGTRFDVRRIADGVRVILAEGKVSVRDTDYADGQIIILQPGHSAWLDGTSPPLIQPVDVLAATSWISGHVTFSNTPLEDAIKEINRYSKRPVVLAAEALRDARINGVFETGDTKAFLDAVTVALPLQVIVDADGQTRLVAAYPPT